MTYGKAFKGTVECPECGEELTVYSDVRLAEHEVDECPECGVQDVEMGVVDGMEAV